MVNQVRRGSGEIVVLKEFGVWRDHPAHRVSRGKREQKDELDLGDSKASRAPRGTQAIGDPRDREGGVRLGLRGHKGSKGQRVNAESLGRGQEDPLDLWDPKGSAVRWGSKVPRETQAQQDPRASGGAMDSKAIKEHQDRWAALDYGDQRVIVGCKDPRVILVSKAPKATRVMSGFEVLQVPLVFLVRQEHKDPLARGVQLGQWAAVVSRGRRARLGNWGLEVPRGTKATEV
jgi:hypothetical protein